ncbi:MULTISPECIES: polysaccharide biosynthesis C-terminal domain-containing protein [unclassified Lentimicrobium]|uniref:polysaccharide biosynthesis C-terminal domain-containing protein n=1 Tax=unclassified Lentimicrobium TaxID=2677434 RepID=UPI001552DCDE|nr:MULTISPECIES: polysaccharide biosynthesis C-terminal domain-containing protein [unclassified Lentimicrobium]NPD47972.1 polysaccharide biosynthesis protein [Lentimicrobium sp. S6]NPD86962.1 polysaccharide biosynthesis protein [Lentimicrobium sp. L6]
MSALKRFLGQTAIYGLSSIVGRLLTYFLVPLYTYNLPTGEYGMVTELFSYVAILFALLTYGMETTFFRFSETEKNKDQVISTSSISLLVSSLIFLALSWTFRTQIAQSIGYESHQHFINWFIIIISFDALSAIPFAYLRQKNKAVRFVSLKLINIFVNLGLNLFFILYCPKVIAEGESHFLFSWIHSFFEADHLVQYIFISNLVASGLTFAFLLPIYKYVKLGFNTAIWKKMMPYALPILMVNIAGLIPISLDKILLPILYSGGREAGMQQLGIYGANAKIAVIMLLFIQTFRYAADPFFFAEAKNKDAKQTYALVMHWFVIFGSLIFLGAMFFIDIIQYFIGNAYRDGIMVVPILLMGNLMLGIYYNLSFWYKLTDKTMYGAWFSVIGAMVAIVLNFILVPKYGMLGSAWSVFIAYLIPAILSYVIGRKHYPIPYKVNSMIAYPIIVVALYVLSAQLEWNLLGRIIIFILFSFGVLVYENKALLKKYFNKA